MTQPHDEPELDDVIQPREQAIRDRREHGKIPRPVNDENLARRTEQERAELRSDRSPE
jgi:hypothetical protein